MPEKTAARYDAVACEHGLPDERTHRMREHHERQAPLVQELLRDCPGIVDQGIPSALVGKMSPDPRRGVLAMAAVMMGPGDEMRLVHRAPQFVIAFRMLGQPVNDVHGADGRAHVVPFPNRRQL